MLVQLGEMLFFVLYNLVEYIILLFLMQYVCSAHINLTRKNLLTACGITGVLLTLASLSNNYFIEFFSLPLSLAVTVFLFSSSKRKDLWRFFPALAIYMILTVMPDAIFNELAPTWNQRFFIGDDYLQLITVITDIILLILLLILRHILMRYDTIVPFTKKEAIGSFALLFFCMIDILLLMTLNRTKVDTATYYIWIAIFIGGLTLSVIYYFYNMIDSRIRFYRQTLTKNETEFLQMQLETLQDVKENEEQVRRMRHDLKNHLEVIQSLCEEGNLDELKKYTQQLNKENTLAGSGILTGNKIADIILRSKSKLAEELGIRFTFTGALDTLEKIEAPDICGLLSNAYDNAIEACQDLADAYIHTEVQTTRNYTVIYISNSTKEKVRIRNNCLTTTKADKHNHGYGTSIMKRIARKYNGNCTFHYEENVFRVKIVLLT